MDTRNSSMFAANQRRRREEPQSSSNLWNSRIGNHLYPSSFYSSTKEEQKENPPENRAKKKGGPLILPPPPTVSVDRKKMIHQEEEKEKERGQTEEPQRKKKREDEIIPLPEDHDDEILFEKKEQEKPHPKLAQEEIHPGVEEIWEELHEDDELELLNEIADDAEELFPKDDDDWFEEEHKEETEGKETNYIQPKIEKKPAEIKKARLPVLLLRDEFEIDIFDSFTLMLPLTNVSKVDWKVHSFKGYALPPSDKVFLELVLSADIEFVSQKKGSLQTLKIYVPLQKTVTVKWLTPPDMPHTSSREMYFKEKDGMSISTHREWEEKLVPNIKFHLNSFKVIWHDELRKGKQGKSQLGIQGTAKISVEASQEQTVSINT
jgi:hypothetical protein